mmetsp:Transcript_3140/g.6309  ORF Transcript_3140/g.6309 Transcript_3140/m.6309 type:complete len:271 (-) Transcript_3140:1272-2084(-)
MRSAFFRPPIRSSTTFTCSSSSWASRKGLPSRKERSCWCSSRSPYRRSGDVTCEYKGMPREEWNPGVHLIMLRLRRRRSSNISERVEGALTGWGGGAFLGGFCTALFPFFCCGGTGSAGGSWEEKRKGMPCSSAKLLAAAPAISMNSVTMSMLRRSGMEVMVTSPSASTDTLASGKLNPSAPDSIRTSLNLSATASILPSSSSPSSSRRAASSYERRVTLTKDLHTLMSSSSPSSERRKENESAGETSLSPMPSSSVTASGSIGIGPCGR